MSKTSTSEPRPEVYGETQKQTLEIEFLYLDLSVCTRCRETVKNLDDALSEVAQVLAATGHQVITNKVHVQSEEQAHELGFAVSPTIRINGQDIQRNFKIGRCDSCGELCGGTCQCRVWEYQGQEYTAAPKAMIIEAILREVYGEANGGGQGTPYSGNVPENLKRFFAGKQRREIARGRGQQNVMSKERSYCCDPAESELYCPQKR